MDTNVLRCQQPHRPETWAQWVVAMWIYLNAEWLASLSRDQEGEGHRGRHCDQDPNAGSSAAARPLTWSAWAAEMRVYLASEWLQPLVSRLPRDLRTLPQWLTEAFRRWMPRPDLGRLRDAIVSSSAAGFDRLRRVAADLHRKRPGQHHCDTVLTAPIGQPSPALPDPQAAHGDQHRSLAPDTPAPMGTRIGSLTRFSPGRIAAALLAVTLLVLAAMTPQVLIYGLEMALIAAFFYSLLWVPLVWFAEILHLIDDHCEWHDWRQEPVDLPIVKPAIKTGPPCPDLRGVLEAPPIPRRCRIAWAHRYPRMRLIRR